MVVAIKERSRGMDEIGEEYKEIQTSNDKTVTGMKEQHRNLVNSIVISLHVD